MPKKNQKSVSMPDWVWEEAVLYFNEHKNELKYKKIRSVTGLIISWVLERKRQIDEASASQSGSV